MSSVLLLKPGSKQFEDYLLGRRYSAALRRGEDPVEAEKRFQVDRAERKRMAPIFAEEAALRYLRPRATLEDRDLCQVYDKYYKRQIESLPTEAEERVRHQYMEGQVASWAIWKFGDLGRDDLRQEVELESLLLKRDGRTETSQDADGSWTHPSYIRTCLKNRIRDYVRPELERRRNTVLIGDMEHEVPVEDFYADVLFEVGEFNRASLREGLLLAILSPSDLPTALRERLLSILTSMTAAETRSLVDWATGRYLRDHGIEKKASVPDSVQRALHRIVTKYLPLINEMR